jgi:hypothetical protein
MFMPNGVVAVSNGKSNGRSFHDQLMEGKIVIQSPEFRRVVYVKDGQIIDNKLLQHGRQVSHIVYGKFERIGDSIVRFRKGSGKGKHGKSRTHEELFGHRGVCHSWYNNGRLVRQKFFYENGHLAYDYRFHGKECVVKDQKGKVLFRLKGMLDCRRMWCGHAVLNKSNPVEWFLPNYPFEVWKSGKLTLAGQYEGRHRTGRWVENGKVTYYEKGVPLPKKLYETPPEKLNVKAILSLSNAQSRMALMSKLPPEQIAEAGRVIHRQGDMRLYDIRGYEARILRVRCPSTGSFYYLNVPHDSTHCEQARQWTFHVGDDFRKAIRFVKET